MIILSHLFKSSMMLSTISIPKVSSSSFATSPIGLVIEIKEAGSSNNTSLTSKSSELINNTISNPSGTELVEQDESEQTRRISILAQDSNDGGEDCEDSSRNAGCLLSMPSFGQLSAKYKTVPFFLKDDDATSTTSLEFQEVDTISFEDDLSSIENLGNETFDDVFRPRNASIIMSKEKNEMMTLQRGKSIDIESCKDNQPPYILHNSFDKTEEKTWSSSGLEVWCVTQQQELRMRD